MFNEMGNAVFPVCFITRAYIDDNSAVGYQSGYPVMNESDTIVECVKEKIDFKILVMLQMYHIMIRNRNFLIKVFVTRI